MRGSDSHLTANVGTALKSKDHQPTDSDQQNTHKKKIRRNAVARGDAPPLIFRRLEPWEDLQCMTSLTDDASNGCNPNDGLPLGKRSLYCRSCALFVVHSNSPVP